MSVEDFTPDEAADPYDARAYASAITAFFDLFYMFAGAGLFFIAIADMRKRSRA